MAEPAQGIQRLRSMYPWPATPPNVVADHHGWLTSGTARTLARFVGPQTHLVVELGSWLGLSARHMLQAAPHAVVVCVDTWLGSYEHIRPAADPAVRARVPTLYDTFLANMWPWRDRVVPVRADTVAGMWHIHSCGLVPDVVYVDAAHDYWSVVRDIETAISLWPTAQLVGDDYIPQWAGVMRAVQDVAARHGLHVEVDGQGWALRAAVA